MKKLKLSMLLLFVHLVINGQNYPFQDIRLSEDERIRNLISFLTIDEKINSLSTMLSIPRLGIKGTHTVEGLHGLAYSGPANWAVKGTKASPTTTFPQAIGLAEMWDPELIQRGGRLGGHREQISGSE